MSNARKDQRQIWSDKLFKDKLEEIMAKRRLIGKPVKSYADLQKEMLKCHSFKVLEQELLKTHATLGLRIKIDKKLLEL